MSPHAVNNFVSDLVLMAQAMERLPQVEAELNQSHKEVAGLANTVARREEHILELKGVVEALHTRIRELEVAKDAAETMFLEADDRTTRALEFVKTMFGSAGSLIQALEPAKPQPEPVVQAKPIDPVPVTQDRSGDVPHWQGPDFKADNSAQGQSEPDPTPVSIQQGEDTNIGSAHGSAISDNTASSQASWATPSPQPDTPPQPKPYAGRYYIDVKGWVSRDDWLAGGGTNESYDFRH